MDSNVTLIDAVDITNTPLDPLLIFPTDFETDALVDAEERERDLVMLIDVVSAE